jgi:hypothetical protein
VTNQNPKQTAVLSFIAVFCVLVALSVLNRTEAFGCWSEEVQVDFSLRPELIRWLLAIVIGLVTAQLLALLWTKTGLSAGLCRCLGWFRDIEEIAPRVRDIHEWTKPPEKKP